MAVWKWIHKSVRKAPILRQVWQLPSLNSHNSDPRGPIDLNYFSMPRPLPGLGDGHINCPQSPFLARVISVQSIDTKWFWAFFYGTASLFWFSLVLLPLSGFWPFSFKPRLASLGGVITDYLKWKLTDAHNTVGQLSQSELIPDVIFKRSTGSVK